MYKPSSSQQWSTQDYLSCLLSVADVKSTFCERIWCEACLISVSSFHDSQLYARTILAAPHITCSSRTDWTGQQSPLMLHTSKWLIDPRKFLGVTSPVYHTALPTLSSRAKMPLLKVQVRGLPGAALQAGSITYRKPSTVARAGSQEQGWNKARHREVESTPVLSG